jgi:TIR domain
MNPRSHVFVSYARSDGEGFAREVHRRLEDEAGLSCWRDRLDLEGGEDFWRQLEAGIAAARWLLVVLTPAALASPWTAKEC